MTYKEKRSIYESIMTEIAKDVKRRINELSLPTVHSYFRKNRKYGMSTEIEDYKKHIDFVISQPLTIFDEMRWTISGSDNYEKESYFFKVQLYKDNKVLLYAEGLMSNDAILDNVYYEMYRPMRDFLKNPEMVEENIDEYNFIRILTRNDSKQLANAINEETGLRLNWRNFYMDYAYDLPSELKNK